MKHILSIILIFIGAFLYANNLQSMSADYEVRYGILGKIGDAHCELEIDKGTYKISIKVQSSGLAKFLQNRKESYESTGLIKDGVLIPTLFVKNRKWKDKEDRKKYFFDHQNKRVSILRTKVVDGKRRDEKYNLSYYADNDILTLFFNLKKITKDSNLSQWLRLSAVGARNSDGAIDIKEPDEDEKKEFRDYLGVLNYPLFVTLNKKIFSSKNGEFFINIDKNGVCDKFILKDIFLKGDLVGKITNFTIKEKR